MTVMHFNRRRFLQGVMASAWVGSSVRRASAASRSANQTVNIACVGVGGKGASDLRDTSVGHNIVAICDVDEQRLAAAAKDFPKAHTYTDWRKLLEQRDIDAVTISTPDHMHAPVTVAAMQRGKHVFTQKPLTRTVYESRRMAEIAAAEGLVTQMGIQHHASARMKRIIRAIHDGVIGKVSEVHAWTDRPGLFWKQGLPRPTQHDAVPPHLHWNLWLGVAAERPFVHDLYHPFHWRGWWDFGTGALGDMGCHLLDPVVSALELGPPETVRAEGPKPHSESGPLWCVVQYTFPSTPQTTETVRLIWYEAGRQPPRELFQAPQDWGGSANGLLFVGERGNLFVGFPEEPALFPQGEFANYKWPEIESHNHYREWTSAIADGGETSCPFSYSGPLTETVLLGNVAFRTGATIEWDSPSMTATGVPAADRYLREPYRSGWDVPGLS
jgi:predicted dehydrogenase